MTTINIDGRVTFDDSGAVDVNGSQWTFSATKGWFDGAPSKGGTSDRPNAHGVFAERTWKDGRLITVTGHVWAPTRRLAADAQWTLAALLAEGTFGDFTVNDPDQGVLTSSVRGEGTPQIDWDGRQDIDCLLTFLAPDPLRYASPVTVSTGFPVQSGGLEYDLYTDSTVDTGFLEYGVGGASGRLTLDNLGNAAVYPIFEIAGPVPTVGFEIIRVGTGERIKFAGSVPAGSSLAIDSATGYAVIDGVADRGGLLTVRDWFSVPAGGSIEIEFVPLGSFSAAQLTASFRPGWW